jgi:hypothetical protein
MLLTMVESLGRAVTEEWADRCAGGLVQVLKVKPFVL